MSIQTEIDNRHPDDSLNVLTGITLSMDLLQVGNKPQEKAILNQYK